MICQNEAPLKSHPVATGRHPSSRLFRKTTVAVPREFSFQECLKFLARSDKERTHAVHPECVRKLIKIDDEPILFELRNMRHGFLEITFLNRLVPASIRSPVIEFVNEWLDLDTNLSPFYRFARKNSLLKQLTTNHYGLRLIKIPDLFEALCWAILGQQINVAFAYTLKQRVVENFGESFVFESATYWRFPTPETIAELQPADLLNLQFNRQKVEYIIGLARLMRDGNVSKQRLLEMSTLENAREALLNIRGVGPWTASYVLMRCLGFRSAFPIEDIGLHNALQRQLNLPRKPSLEEIRNMSAGWGGWQAYVAIYLYRSLL